MKYTNKMGLSNAVEDAIISFAQEYDKVGWKSATTLIDSPRSKILTERHSDEIVEDVSDLIWSFIGNMAHLIAEKNAGKDCIAEQRFIEVINGKEISFKPDRLEKNPGSSPPSWTLRDFKMTSIWILKKACAGELKKEWVKQMNVYAYLLGVAGFNVTEMKLEIFGRDWRLSEQRQSPHDYPSKQCGVFDVPMWDAKEMEKYIHERIELYKKCENLSDNELPRCSEEERWAKPDLWAVVKKDGAVSKATGYKKALPKAGGFTSYMQAADFIEKQRYPKIASANPKPETIAKAEKEAAQKANGLEIEYRKGKSTRCEDGYCNAVPFCNQYREEINPVF